MVILIYLVIFIGIIAAINVMGVVSINPSAIFHRGDAASVEVGIMAIEGVFENYVQVKHSWPSASTWRDDVGGSAYGSIPRNVNGGDWEYVVSGGSHFICWTYIKNKRFDDIVDYIQSETPANRFRVGQTCGGAEALVDGQPASIYKEIE